MTGPNNETPKPAHKNIADVVENAPAFSEADAPPPEVEKPAKRGRGRPKKEDKGEAASQARGVGVGAALGSCGAIWSPQYDMRESGLWFCPKGDNPSWLSSAFEVVGMVRTSESQAWALYVRFRDPDDIEQTLIIPLSELCGDGANIRRQFADKGLMMSGQRAGRERFSEALSSVRTSQRLLLVGQTGWTVDGEAFALPHRTITAVDAEPIVFEGRARGAHFAEAGDLASWRDCVAAKAAGQSRLLLALGLALSGPLLEMLGIDGGGFHLVGGSSIGKTTAERMGGSVWGGGGQLGFAQSWRTTANALEGVAAAHNDTFLALDEIGLCEPHDLGAAAYALSGGQGKGRMKSDSEMRSRMRWRIAILSSGEMSLVARIAEGSRNNRARAGQEVRIIDLQADAGRGYGIFDHPGPTGDPGDLSNVIRDATQTHYGFAGPAFVEVLLKHRSQTIAGVRGIIAAFKANHVPAGANGQIGRVAERFALAAAAGEIAIGAKILPFAPGAVLEAAEGLFKGWIAARGGVGASESRAAVDAMRQFIQAHGKSRFIRMDDDDKENHSFRVMNAAGHYSHSKGLFYLNEFGWQEAVAGLERRAAAEALFAAGYLKKDREGKTKRPVYIDGKTRRMIAISDAILEGDENV